MAKLAFDDIKGAESGKIGVVCGLGGSLTPYVEEFEKLSRESDDYCFISCNNIDKISNMEIDYWVIANTLMTIGNSHARLNKGGATIVYADSVDNTNRAKVDSYMVSDYLPYDERHHGSSRCIRPKECCRHLIKGRKTIQEELRSYTSGDKRYSSCGTVAIHMLALAVILGCKKIYVVGVDMDYSTGYANNYNNSNPLNHLKKHTGQFHVASEIIRKSAEKMGVEIINLNKGARYNSLKKGEFDD